MDVIIESDVTHPSALHIPFTSSGPADSAYYDRVKFIAGCERGGFELVSSP